MTGITGAAKELFIGSGLGPYEILAIMVLIWFVLGCIIDSISIILLTVPVFRAVAAAVGFDPLAFAIMGIIAIETGLLTPPFGILVFTVKAALPEENIKLGEIFRAAIPFWLCLLFAIVVIAVFRRRPRGCPTSAADHLREEPAMSPTGSRASTSPTPRSTPSTRRWPGRPSRSTAACSWPAAAGR